MDYIEFIDLDILDSASVFDVVPDSVGLVSSDYSSEPVFVDQGIPVGATGELTTMLYVRNWCLSASWI